jgi:hypothetical protein
MQNESRIFRPTVRGIFTLIIGLLTFSLLSIFLLTKNLNTSDKSTSVIVYFIAGLFVLFAIMSVYYIFKIKIIITNTDYLTIKYPLKFKSYDIRYNEILTSGISPQIIKTSTRSGIITVYEGKRIILNLDNNFCIDIDSFQTENFKELLEILTKRIKA